MGQSTEATCARPASVGHVVRWTFRLTDGTVEWDWSLGPPDPKALCPIRSPRSTEKSRHIPVQAYSVTVGEALRLESGLEHDLLMALDRDPWQRWFVPQPARLRLGRAQPRRARVHTPDLMSVDAGGRVTIWDVRPESKQDERFQQASSSTAAACADIGWEYEVFAGLPDVRRYNLRWLTAYRMPMPWYHPAKALLQGMCASGNAVVADVLGADQGAGHLVSAMWHYAWTGDLVLDLDQSLTRQTVVRWRAAEHEG